MVGLNLFDFNGITALKHNVRRIGIVAEIRKRLTPTFESLTLGAIKTVGEKIFYVIL